MITKLWSDIFLGFIIRHPPCNKGKNEKTADGFSNVLKRQSRITLKHIASSICGDIYSKVVRHVESVLV